MDANVQALCIQYITDEWRKLKPYEFRDDSVIPPPWGVWIRMYEPITPSTTESEYITNKVWFLDKAGLRERGL